MYNNFQGCEIMEIFVYILLILMSYLYGSIPFALVVGKLFYHTDVRESGSGTSVEQMQAEFLEKKQA